VVGVSGPQIKQEFLLAYSRRSVPLAVVKINILKLNEHWYFRFSRRRVWSWLSVASLKHRQTSTRLHGATSQKTVISEKNIVLRRSNFPNAVIAILQTSFVCMCIYCRVDHIADITIYKVKTECFLCFFQYSPFNKIYIFCHVQMFTVTY
jgi:hypothetical protein